MSETAPDGFDYIKIQGHHFLCSQPYAEGHVLSTSEADALNQMRSENLRNNFAAQMRKAASEGKEPPTAEDFAAYDRAYTFGQKRERGTGTVRDPVGAAERKLAEGALRDKIAAIGQKWKDYDNDHKKHLIDQIITRGTYRERAMEMVAAEAEVRAANVAALADLEI